MTKWLLAEDRLEEARQVGRHAGQSLARRAGRRRKDAAAVARRVAARIDRCRRRDARNWPRGRVSVDDLPAAPANRRDVTRRAQVEYQLGLRKLHLEQIYRHGARRLAMVHRSGQLPAGRSQCDRERRVSLQCRSRNAAMRRFAGNSDLGAGGATG